MGETLSILERVIIAPAAGVFQRVGGSGRGGNRIGRGDVIGVVQSLRTSTPVQSPFDGLLIEMVALDGERVRSGQRVAWLRVE